MATTIILFLISASGILHTRKITTTLAFSPTSFPKYPETKAFTTVKNGNANTIFSSTTSSSSFRSLDSSLTSTSTSTSKTSSSSPSDTVEPPIHRVAIIGAGIAGLSLAHSLSSQNCARTYLNARRESDDNNNDGKSELEIVTKVFDSRPPTTDILKAGAGIQLTGGMSVLRRIDPILQRAVADASLPLRFVRSRSKPWSFSNSTTTAASSYSTLLELDLEKVIRDTGGDTLRELIVPREEEDGMTGDEEVMAYSIMRGALQEVLLENLPPSADITFGKTLTNIQSSPDNQEDDNNGNDEGIFCAFSDGSIEGPFDLVVGCDGIRSVVKDFVENGKISSLETTAKGEKNMGKVEDSALYSGIRIQYAIMDGEINDDEKFGDNDDDNETGRATGGAELRQYFGDGAYALAGTYGAGVGRPPSRGAFLVYRDEGYIGPFRKGADGGVSLSSSSSSSSSVEGVIPDENTDWRQETPSMGGSVGMRRKIAECSVPDIEVGPIVDAADRFFELGVYFHNPLGGGLFPSGWSSAVPGTGGRRCVLSGDAAHAMPPFLGQGANQAIQDSYCLATKIFQHNTNCLVRVESGLVVEEGDIDTKGNVENDNRGDAEVDITTDAKEKKKSLKKLLKEYEDVRWKPTASITAKSAFLGYLETGGVGLPSQFRDVFFRIAGLLGIAKKVFLGAATPKL